MIENRMDAEAILREWEQDARIDETELGRASLDIPRLHHKYYKLFVRENLTLKRMEAKSAELKRDKFEFYTGQGTKEQFARGWKLPPKGAVLKAEAERYMEADPDIIESNLAIAYQREGVDALREILKMIKDRNWHIGRAIEDMKFKAGA